MSRHHLAQHGSTKSTPQTQRIPGRTDQVENEAGGYVFAVDRWERLRRFLILGTEGGSYYATERKMTTDSIDALRACTDEDASRVLAMIREISHAGLAPKNDQAIFALAYVLSFGDNAAKTQASLDLPLICRTGTHLFLFAEFIETLSGWGRAKRRAVARWYTGKSAEQLAYQLVKYRQRDGWTHRDLLRLAHPSGEHAGLYAWAAHPERGADDIAYAAPIIRGFVEAQSAIDVDRMVELIQQYRLPREALPTEALKHAKVWEALLYAGPGMPITAMIRNLPTMTRNGLLVPLSGTIEHVTARLTDPTSLQHARVHPMQLLIARLTYASGRSLRGSSTWAPVPQIIDALDHAFYLAFKNVEPSGKRILLGVDWSGSMGAGMIGGIPGFTPALGAAAMALVTAATEPNYYVVAFASNAKPVTITTGMTLSEVYARTAKNTGEGTDVAVPIQVALSQSIDADAFVLYTDSQTWAGKRHVTQMLDTYRKTVQHDVRFVATGMVANEFTVSDPRDPHSLDVVGFDSSAPAVISNFVAGRIS